MENIELNPNSDFLEIVQKDVYDYCSLSLEDKGNDDAANNPDLPNRDLNKNLIIAGLKNKIQYYLPLLQNKIIQYEQFIKMYTDNGMVKTAAPFETKRENYKNELGALKKLLEDDTAIEEKLHWTLLSYEIGFNNGMQKYLLKF